MMCNQRIQGAFFDIFKSMRSFLILFVFIFAEHSRAQIIFDKVKYDFGDLEAYDDRFVDIRVTNKGSKREYLLSVKKPLDVVYLVNGQFIEKDSSLIVQHVGLHIMP